MMSATTTIPKSVSERAALIEELEKLEAEWLVLVAPFSATIEEAENEVRAAEAAVESARRKLIAAECERAAAVYPADRRRDAIRNLLENELADPRIISALNGLSAIEADARETKIPAPSGGDRAARKEVAAAAKAIAARLNWIRGIGRPALLELRFCDPAAVEDAIAGIMADLPAV